MKVGWLQTFGSSGAGERNAGWVATNVRLRWSRGGNACRGLQTFGSAGAGAASVLSGYQHSAPTWDDPWARGQFTVRVMVLGGTPLGFVTVMMWAPATRASGLMTNCVGDLPLTGTVTPSTWTTAAPSKFSPLIMSFCGPGLYLTDSTCGTASGPTTRM